jgi:hypothetical protein
MGRERMPQRMTGRGFWNPSLEPSFFESFLYNRFVKMMSAFLSSDPINVMADRRKNPSASPTPWPRLGIFVQGRVVTKHRQSLIPHHFCNVL